MFTLKMNVNGVTRSLQLLVDSLSPRALKKPLSEISKAKQAEVRQRFEQSGPGWEPRAVSTMKQEAGRIDRAERESQVRSGKRLGQVLSSQLKVALKRGAKASTIDKRRLEIAVLRELRGGDVSTFDVRLRGAYDAASATAREEARQRLFARSLKSREKVTGRLLGRLANSIKAQVDGTKLVVLSEVKWSGVHNDGGAVGRGATVPERTFLEWTEADYTTATEAFERHMLKAVEG